MKSNKIFVALIVFVLMSSLVLADFALTPGKGIDPLCPRATGLFTDYVKNLNGEVGFTVNVDGSEAASWSTPTPEGFILNQGEEKVVYTYVTPVESAKSGTYNLDVVVSQNGVTKKITHSVNVKECYSAGLTSVQKTQSTCPGSVSDLKYEFVLKNTGLYEENYQISADGDLKSGITLTETNLVLKSGEQKSIYAYVKVPSDQKPGTNQFTITAKGSSVNGAVENAQANVVVNDCFAFTSVPEKYAYEMCDSSSLTIPVTIKNTGTNTNTFNADLKNAPAWASLDKKTVELGAGSSQIINIILKPEYKTAGNFNLNLEVIPKDGKNKAVSDIKINVRSCHGVNVDIAQTESTICASETGKYDILVENTGEVSKEYVLEQGKGSLSENRITLMPKQKKTVYLTINTDSNQSTKTEDIKVEAKATDESKVSDSDSMKFTVDSISDCYKPEVTLHNKDIVVYYDSAAAVEVDVKNTGIRTAKYNLALSGTGADFMQIAPASITVEPGKTGKTSVYFAPSIKDGSFKTDVTASVQNSGVLDSDTLNARITKNKDEATKGIIDTKKTSLWQRIKNWLKNKFGEKQAAENKSVAANASNVVTKENKTVANKTAVNATKNETKTIVTVPNKTVENKTTVKLNVSVSNKTTTISTFQNKTIQVNNLVSLNSLNFKPIAQVQMNTTDVYGFNVNGEEHTVKLDKIGNKTVTLVFSSDPVKVDFKIGEVKELDLNNDSVKDVKVTLNGIANNKADVTYELIKKESSVSLLSKVKSKLLAYKLYIVAGILALVLLILITKYKKQISEFFEDEEVKPTETPKAEEPKAEHKKEEKHKK